MSVPPEILQAVAANGGGKITLVVGAGCSFEAPTAIPLARTCSQECHDQLVANGILSPGDCANPMDLSCLADAVFAKCDGRQAPLVAQLLDRYSLKTASPNKGHLLAAALLRESAISSLVTLNFDLALTTAIAFLGVGDSIGVVDGPSELGGLKTVNLYYLHRNANSEAEQWVLRTATLTDEWKGHWEEVIAKRVLTTPVVIYAGLGSPAEVFVATSQMINKAIPAGTKAYQVDPGEPENSAFFAALGLDRARFVKMAWCEFMEAIAQRLASEHVHQIQTLGLAMIAREGFHQEDLTSLLDRLTSIGLIELGSLRSQWLLHDKAYLAADSLRHEFCADLLIGLAMIARETATEAVLFSDGVVEFRRGDRVVAAFVVASGRGTRGYAAMEAALSSRAKKFLNRPTPLSGMLVSATLDGASSPIAPPDDVVLGDIAGDIIYESSAKAMFHLQVLRADPGKCNEVVP